MLRVQRMNGFRFRARLKFLRQSVLPSRRTALAKGGRKFDGYVALGCVIRGETTHYDYVCQESARALQDLANNHLAPIGYGILTCENGDQAWERAGQNKGNKGAAAVEACLAMVALRHRFKLS